MLLTLGLGGPPGTDPEPVDAFRRLDDPEQAVFRPLGLAQYSPQTGDLKIGQVLDFKQDGSCGCGDFLPGAALTYNSDTVRVQPIFENGMASANGMVSATTFDLNLHIDIGTPGEIDSSRTESAAAGGQAGEVGIQTGSPVQLAGFHAYELDGTIHLADGTTVPTIALGRAFADVRDNTTGGNVNPLGNGWGIAGLNYVVHDPVTGDVALVYGSGGFHLFKYNAFANVYLPPNNDFGVLDQGGYRYTTPDKTVWIFGGPNGEVTSVTDRHGLSRTISYSGPGAPATWTEPDGGVTTFSYTGGFLSSITAPGGRVTTIVNSGGDIVSITNPNGGTRSITSSAGRITGQTFGPASDSYGYDAQGLVRTLDGGGSVEVNNTAAGYIYRDDVVDNPGAITAKVTDPLGHDWFYMLDRINRPLELDSPDGYSQTWVWGGAGPTSYTDQLGRTSYWGYDGLGGVTLVSLPASAPVSYTYDATFHQVTHETISTFGFPTTTYTLDPANGDALTITDALGNNTTQTWTNGRIASVTDRNGGTTAYHYNSAMQLTSVVDAIGHTTSYTHDGAGNVLSETDANGHTTAYTYDGMRNLLTTTDALSGVTSNTYDALGDVLTLTDALGHTTSYTYNPWGLPISATDALGRTSTSGYDAAGNLVSETDNNGHTTTYTYDLVNDQTTMTDALGYVTHYVPDAVGNVISLIDPLGHVTSKTYDGADRPLSTTDALNHTWSTTYDGVGNVTQETDPNGVATSYQYDLLFRTTRVTDANGFHTDIVYDPEGNATALTDGRGNTTHFVFDAVNQQTGATDALGHNSTTSYDPAGNVVSSTDENGHTSTLVYDALNRPITQTDALGNSTHTAYDAAGNVTSDTDQLGHTTHYFYDDLNEPIQVTDALGHSSYTGYDANGNTLSETDALGHTTHYQYDALNQPTLLTDALGGTVTTAYDDVGNAISTTNELGNTWHTAFDAADRPITETDPLGNTGHVGYDAAGNVASATDALGNSWTFTHDGLGQLLSATSPLNEVTSVAYDGNGNVTAVTNPRGATTHLSYDALDRPSSLTDALGGVSSVAYDAVGNATGFTNPNGDTWTAQYDALNRLTSQSDPLGNTSSQTYDSTGNVVTQTDAAGFTTHLNYDALNRLASVQNALGGTSTTAYDAVSNVITQTDELGHATHTAYDALNKPTDVTDAVGGVTHTGYDAANNVTLVQDSVGNQTHFSFNADNDLTSMTDPLSHTATYAYNADGQLTSLVDRNGRQDLFGYNADGRLTGEVWKDAGGTTTNQLAFTYDANGNVLTAMKDGTGYTMTYDGLDRVVSEAEPFNAGLTFNYDAAGNRTQMHDSFGGTTSYSFDAAERLVGEQYQTPALMLGGSSTFLRAALTYTSRDQVASVSRYEGPTVGPEQFVGQSAYGYDALGRMTSLQHQNGQGTTLANYVYTFDAASRLTSETDNGTTTNYTNDATNQLTGENSTGYSYDANGNRAMTGYTTGTGNQLLSDGTWNYTYDNEGNTVKKVNISTGETWTYGYDNRNQMTWAEDRASDGGTLLMHADYTYDAFGNRIQTAVDPDDAGSQPAVTSRFAFDPANGQTQPWADMDANNNQIMHRVYLADAVFARVDAAGNAAWYLPDHLGSIRQVADLSGSVQDTITYDAFGNVTSESNPSFGDRYKWKGAEKDAETGLLLIGQGFYDPATGRWTTQDPSGFGGGDANTYRSYSNDPTDQPSEGERGATIEVPPAERADAMRRFLEAEQQLLKENGWKRRKIYVPSESDGKYRTRMPDSFEPVSEREFISQEVDELYEWLSKYRDLLPKDQREKYSRYLQTLRELSKALRKEMSPGALPDLLDEAREALKAADLVRRKAIIRKIEENEWYERAPRMDALTPAKEAAGKRALDDRWNKWRKEHLLELLFLPPGYKIRGPDGEEVEAGHFWDGIDRLGPLVAGAAGAARARLRDPKTGRFIPDPANPRSPYEMTDAQRRAEWKRLAQDPNSPLTPAQRAEIKARGWRGPQRVNEKTGECETMELSHEPIPLRDGGKQVVPRWPADHAAVDPKHRFLPK